MEIKDFIENFAEQFDDTTVEMLGAGTKFRELDEWSSLIALSVIAMVDEVYGITIMVRIFVVLKLSVICLTE